MLHINYKSIGVRSISLFARLCKPVTEPTQAEKKIIDILNNHFPSAKTINVEDISGGCGAMYLITVESNEFKGLPTVKQHRLVNEALKEEIKNMHGVRICTSVPS